MSQPNGLLILGDHLFFNYKKKIGQRGLINTAGIINPNLALTRGYIGIYLNQHIWGSKNWVQISPHPGPEIIGGFHDVGGLHFVGLAYYPLVTKRADGDFHYLWPGVLITWWIFHCHVVYQRVTDTMIVDAL